MLKLEERAALTILYQEPHRHYHNLSHIQHCLRELNNFCENSSLSSIYIERIKEAIWYHDAIYDPYAKKGQNEFESYMLLPNSSRAIFVALMIESTVEHKIIQEGINRFKERFEEECSIFLDIDLSILGQMPTIYDEYTKNIRKEYSFVPGQIYREERMKVLNSLLNRNRLYFTDYFYNLYEKQARENINYEINNLTEWRF